MGANRSPPFLGRMGGKVRFGLKLGELGASVGVAESSVSPLERLSERGNKSNGQE